MTDLYNVYACMRVYSVLELLPLACQLCLYFLYDLLSYNATYPIQKTIRLGD